MKIRSLYVPASVSLRTEIWRGLSVVDAVKSVIIGVIVALIDTVLHFIIGVEIIWCVFGATIAAALSVTLLTQYNSGLSIIDYLRISIKFSREQKRFYYVYRRNK